MPAAGPTWPAVTIRPTYAMPLLAPRRAMSRLDIGGSPVDWGVLLCRGRRYAPPAPVSSERGVILRWPAGGRPRSSRGMRPAFDQPGGRWRLERFAATV